MGENANSVNLGSTLKNISKSFSEFSEAFSRVNENYKKLPILNNKLFQLPGHTFDEDFFDANATQERYIFVKGITWEKLTQQNNLLSKNNVNEILKCNLDQRKYEMLKNGWKRVAKKLGNSGKKADDIYSFISRPVKGSKKVPKNSRLQKNKSL